MDCRLEFLLEEKEREFVAKRRKMESRALDFDQQKKKKKKNRRTEYVGRQDIIISNLLE